jgi:hypothetical protein
VISVPDGHVEWGGSLLGSEGDARLALQQRTHQLYTPTEADPTERCASVRSAEFVELGVCGALDEREDGGVVLFLERLPEAELDRWISLKPNASKHQGARLGRAVRGDSVICGSCICCGSWIVCGGLRLRLQVEWPVGG